MQHYASIAELALRKYNGSGNATATTTSIRAPKKKHSAYIHAQPTWNASETFFAVQNERQSDRVTN